jgi:hypothetical protein
LKNTNIKNAKLSFHLLFHIGVKLGFLILRKEERLRVFEKSVHVRTFRPEREEVTEWWRML